MIVTDTMIRALLDLSAATLVVNAAGRVVSGTWINTNTRRALVTRDLIDQWPPAESPAYATTRRVKWYLTPTGEMVVSAYRLGVEAGRSEKP